VEAVKNVCCEIDRQSYVTEWNSEIAKAQLAVIADIGRGVTRSANNILARTLEDNIVAVYHDVRSRKRMMDVGVGDGDTIIPLLKMMNMLASAGRIPKDYLRYTQIFLVDVSQKNIEVTMERMRKEIPHIAEYGDITALGNIVSVRTSLADMPNDPTLRTLEGKVDVIFSGGTFCHQSDKEDTFAYMHRLLADKGVLHLWDWYNGPSFAASRLRLSTNNKRKTLFRVDHTTYCVPDEYYEPMMRRILPILAGAREYDVTYEITEEDSEAVKANFMTLLSILGYVSRDERGIRCVKKKGEEDVDWLLDEMYDEMIHDENGFSYINDFLSGLQDIRPFFESAYFLIEGYGDDYAELMKKAGFSAAWNEKCSNVYSRYRDAAETSLTAKIQKDQLRYTFGVK
jgi:SAM-dependent methyltransferase